MPDKTYFLGIPWTSEDCLAADGAVITITADCAQRLLYLLEQAQALQLATPSFCELQYDAVQFGCAPVFVYLENLAGLKPEEYQEIADEVSVSDAWQELPPEVTLAAGKPAQSQYSTILLRVTPSHILWQALLGRVVVETATLSQEDLTALARAK